jgi:hypothetical protein
MAKRGHQLVKAGAARRQGNRGNFACPEGLWGRGGAPCPWSHPSGGRAFHRIAGALAGEATKEKPDDSAGRFADGEAGRGSSRGAEAACRVTIDFALPSAGTAVATTVAFSDLHSHRSRTRAHCSFTPVIERLGTELPCCDSSVGSAVALVYREARRGRSVRTNLPASAGARYQIVMTDATPAARRKRAGPPWRSHHLACLNANSHSERCPNGAFQYVTPSEYRRHFLSRKP